MIRGVIDKVRHKLLRVQVPVPTARRNDVWGLRGQGTKRLSGGRAYRRETVGRCEFATSLIGILDLRLL